MECATKAWLLWRTVSRCPKYLVFLARSRNRARGDLSIDMMPKPNQPLPAHAVLQEHAAGIRSLALRLLRDPGLADDVVQDTWLASRESPPSSNDNPRGWLYAVSKNLARKRLQRESRRTERERCVAKGERIPSTLELSERMETKRRLLDALDALREPYRSTLIVRYFDDRKPREIAAAQNTPVATVKSRLYRGLSELRMALDDSHDGDRRAWALPLVSMATTRPVGSSGITALLGGILMKKTTAAFVVLVLLTGGAWVLLQDGTKLSNTTLAEEEPGASAPLPIKAEDVPGPEAPTIETPLLKPQPQTPPTMHGPATAEVPRRRSGELVVIGRAVDEQRQPLEGAVVTFHTVYGLGEKKTYADATTTARDGTFAVGGIGPHAENTRLLATIRHKELRAFDGALVRESSSTHVDMGTFVLLPMRSLRVHVVDIKGSPVEGASIYVESVARWMGGLTVARAVTASGISSEDGAWSIDNLAAGGYRIVATKAGHGRGTNTWQSDAPGKVQVALGNEHTLRVRVHDQRSGRPVAGASVHVSEIYEWMKTFSISTYVPLQGSLIANEKGEVVLSGLHANDPLYLSATAEGYPRMALPRHPVAVPRDATETTILLYTPRTVRWKISTTGGVPPPPDGTTLRITRTQGRREAAMPTSARIEGGDIVVEGCIAGHLGFTVIAPDGAYAELFVRGIRVEGPKVTFYRPHVLRIRASTIDGAPARGVYISLRSGGNLLYGEPRKTDGEGLARFDAIRHRHGLRLFAGLIANSYASRSLGTIEFTNGVTEHEIVVPTLHTIVVRPTVDGTPQIPHSYFVLVDGMPAEVICEDTSDHSIVVRAFVPNGSRGQITIQAKELACKPVPFEIPKDKVQLSLPVPLQSTNSVMVRVLPPKDGKMSIRVRMPRADQAPPHKWRRPRAFRAEPGGRDGDYVLFRYSGIPSGAFQVGDELSGAATKVIEIKPGTSSKVISLDLSHVGDVRGSVTAPPDRHVGLATIIVSGENLLWEGHRPLDQGFTYDRNGRVTQDGRFSIRIPGDRKVRLTVNHPLALPAKQGGFVELMKPRDGVRLALDASSVIRFRLTPESWPKRMNTVGVMIFGGTLTGKPLRSTRVNVRRDSILEIGGVGPGTYTLVINSEERAPKIIKNVTLGGEDVDLRDLSTERGSSIRVRIRTKSGAKPPTLLGIATATSPFRYARVGQSRGESEFVIPGFLKGKVHLVVQRFTGTTNTTPELETTVEVNGKDDVTIDLEL